MAEDTSEGPSTDPPNHTDPRLSEAIVIWTGFGRTALIVRAGPGSVAFGGPLEAVEHQVEAELVLLGEVIARPEDVLEGELGEVGVLLGREPGRQLPGEGDRLVEYLRMDRAG